MSRFSGRAWLQDKPLSVQLFVKLSLASTAAYIAGIAYMLLAVFPSENMTAEEWLRCGGLCAMALIANIFIAKAITARLTEPFEKLAENMSRIKNKNWKEKIYQVSRKDEVGQIINTLSAIQTNVMEINEDEELFYQSVSHGLKTPIMVIQNCCLAYKDGIYGGEAVDIIMKESLTLEEETKKLLYVASFDHMLGNRSDFVRVDISALCSKCAERLGPSAIGARIELNLSGEKLVDGNAASLEILFGNILENAIRYVHSLVKISLIEDETSYTVIFQNDGEPIPQKTMDMLFDKFYKGPKGSFGLGLYIARKIAIFHGGDIWADNTSDGVQFHVLLKKARSGQQGKSARIAALSHRMRHNSAEGEKKDEL